MSTTIRIMNRTAAALAAGAFLLAAGSGIAVAQDNSGTPDLASSFNAIIGGATVGPLSVPGVTAGPSGANVGGFRVPVPLYPA